MAQNYQEITEFLDIVCAVLPEKRRGLALEIGLYTGGTHLIWKGLFQRVVSVEINASSAVLFMAGLVDTEGSQVVVGNSVLPITTKIVEKTLGQKADLLFIDGDHSASGVESDYFNYEPMVAPGGIIGFHDSADKNGDVRRFVDSLKAGTNECMPGGPKDIKQIHYQMGIDYYIKE
jgi:predicted O-methyltransferase YrrM